MDYSYLWNDYKFNGDNLIRNNFKKEEDYYIKKVDLKRNNFYFLIKINEKEIIGQVFDKDFDSIYLPFNIKENIGSYVSDVQEECEQIVKSIIDNCFKKERKRDLVLKYVKNKYGTLEEYPWKRDENSCTLKVNDKWYGLIMRVSYKVLKIDKEGFVDIINLKSKRVLEVVDNKNIFLAYHMNKKYWLSILLDNNIDINRVYQLIDESYELVK